jgi:succinyl-CoA synthetase alpha subunit
MRRAVRIVPGAYRDSVTLMQLSAEVAALPGIARASLVMATPANLALLAAAGLIERAPEAAPNDLLIALQGRDAKVLEAALAHAERSLVSRQERAASPGEAEAPAPRTLAQALECAPQANLALVSVPGEYAAAEARKALRLGLNAMIFSDNVPIAEEAALKREAAARGLLVLGPDCGTAIVDGLRLGFANHVRRGRIGCIGASGTGLQEVTCLVDRLGEGVSQAIGVGGRDLHQAVGGVATLESLARLAADRDTGVIVLVSKPPAAAVGARVLERAARCGKPVVACFLGMPAAKRTGARVHLVATLEEAGRAAVALARGRRPRAAAAPPRLRLPRVAAPRRYVRGLFTGGTFCYEAAHLLGEALGTVWSNAPADPARELVDPWRSRGHCVVDLGDDVFTRGRPHPMIDPRLRNERLLAEASDPRVAVLLFDMVLGAGAHPDPAGALIPALRAARKAAGRRGGGIALVGSVCGTERDPQGRAKQVKRLRQAGVVVADSNAQAARLAGTIAARAERTR